MVQWKLYQDAVALGEEEALRVEPRFGHAGVQVALGQRALLGVVGEGGGVDGEPGRVVLAGDEGADGDALRVRRLVQRRDREGAAHLAQLAEEAHPQHRRQVAGGRVAAVRPEPQRAAGRLQQGGAQRPAVAAAPVRGMDDQLAAWGLDGVGALQLGVAA